MREAFSILWQTIASIIGAVVLVILFWWLARTHSRMWRLVSARFAGRGASVPVATRPMDTIVIAAHGSTGPLYTGNTAYRAYAGAKIAIHDDGLAVSLMPPFNIMCLPIYLPFAGMALERTHWALWPEPSAIRMQGLPDVDIILGRDTVEWIRQGTDQPPFGQT